MTTHQPIEGCSHPRTKHYHGTTRQSSVCCRAQRGPGAGACEPCQAVNRKAVNRWMLAQMKGTPMMLPSIGTQRRIQGLYALGYHARDIADASERPTLRTAIPHIAKGKWATVNATTAAAIRLAYKRLAGTPAPDGVTRTERAHRARARNWAKANRWATPAAWDDDIDSPDARPHGAIYDDKEWRWAKHADDEVLVQRVCEGEADPSLLSPRNRLEAVRVLTSWRWSDRRIGEHLGIAPRTVVRIRRRGGIDSRWTHDGGQVAS